MKILKFRINSIFHFFFIITARMAISFKWFKLIHKKLIIFTFEYINSNKTLHNSFRNLFMKLLNSRFSKFKYFRMWINWIYYMGTYNLPLLHTGLICHWTRHICILDYSQYEPPIRKRVTISYYCIRDMKLLYFNRLLYDTEP